VNEYIVCSIANEDLKIGGFDKLFLIKTTTMSLLENSESTSNTLSDKSINLHRPIFHLNQLSYE